jgi:putative transposase
MSRPLRLEFPGALWHITSRGNERRDIIRDSHDSRFFRSLLGRVVTERHWILHAWVLMSNHYHLLLETPEPNLSRGVKSLNQEYASWFNSRHDRVGHLFQGRFKGILVERDSHLSELMRYVVLNPVRAAMVDSAEEYPWSSYRATAGLEPAPAWLEIDWTLQRFGSREEYRQFVAARASYRPWEAVIGQIYLGGEAFRERIQERVGVQVEGPAPAIDTLRALVVAEFGEAKRARVRKALAQVARDAGLTLRAIASAVGATRYGVAKMERTARELYATDAAYRERIDRIRAQLKS